MTRREDVPAHKPASDLKPGDVCVYFGHEVLIEEHLTDRVDRFGRPMLAFVATVGDRVEETTVTPRGKRGLIWFGPDADVVVTS